MVSHQSNRIFTRMIHNITDVEQVPLTPLPAWSCQHEYIDLNLKISGTCPCNAVDKPITLNKTRIDVENCRIKYRATNSIHKTMLYERTSAMKTNVSQITGNQRRHPGNCWRAVKGAPRYWRWHPGLWSSNQRCSGSKFSVSPHIPEVLMTLMPDF